MLAGLRGLGVTARAVVGPLAGAVVAMLGLLPSMPAASPPRPALALVGLGAGLALAAMVARPRWLALVLTGGLLVAAVAGVVASGGGVDAGQTVVQARVNLASPDRTGALHAALGLVAQHPLTGTGPGQADLRWKGHDHGSQLYAYVHNEYLQVAAQLGLVGLGLLVVLLVAITRTLWRARPTGQASATWAGVVAAAAAFAVHSGFDFVWHLPAIVLTVALLVGLVLPPPDPAPAHMPSVPVQEEEPDENQAH
jgi:O-antigen ligase